MFIYLPVNFIFNTSIENRSIANHYKLHSLAIGWLRKLKLVDAKNNNILNIGLLLRSRSSLQKMNYSTLKDISLASQSNIINTKGLPIDSTFLQ